MLHEAQRKTANQALGASTRVAQDDATRRAEAVSRALDAIVRERWSRFIRAKKLDAKILTAGLRAELEAAIEDALRGMATSSATDTLRSIAKSVPGEALLVVNKRRKLVTIREAALHESGGTVLAQFAKAASDAARKAASEFLKLPSVAEVTKLIFEPFNGESWTDRLRNWLPVEKDLAKEIANGLSLGKSRQEIARAIRPLVDGSRSAAIRIARTEAHRVNVTAQMRSVTQALGPAVEGWVYVATNDSRVSEEHWALNGTVYGRNEKKPLLPSRPGCRCVYSPIMRSWDSFGLPPEVAAILKKPFGGRPIGK